MRGFPDTDLVIARLADGQRGIVHRRQLLAAGVGPVNAIVCGLEVDFHWPRRRLVVEVDGWTFHRTRRAFERDRERDAILAAGGIRVLRFTHRQVTREPALVAAALRRR